MTALLSGGKGNKFKPVMQRIAGMRDINASVVRKSGLVFHTSKCCRPYDFMTTIERCESPTFSFSWRVGVTMAKQYANHVRRGKVIESNGQKLKIISARMRHNSFHAFISVMCEPIS